MAKVHEITVWARGVIMDKEGRDVINIFAQAAQMEGKFAQAFDNYEDLPDRVLVTDPQIRHGSAMRRSNISTSTRMITRMSLSLLSRPS